MTGRPDPTLVTVEAVRRLSGALPGEIESPIRSGAIKRAAPGRISLVEGVRALIRHVRAQTRDASLAAAMADARAARAESSELALAIEARQLIADDEAQAALDRLVGAIVTAISALPPRATRDLRARAMIDGVLREVQTQIADDLAARAGGEG